MPKKIKHFFSSIRSNYYKLRYLIRGNTIGNGVNMGVHIRMRNTHVGSHCYIGSFCVINNAIIESYCSIAPSVQIGGMEHSIGWLSTNTNLSDKCVSGCVTSIGPDVWIAAGCIIKQGIRIGQGAVVGANSFVNTDVPPYAVVVGSPAKIIRYRFKEKMIKMLMSSDYWKLPPETAKEVLFDIEKEEDVL